MKAFDAPGLCAYLRGLPWSCDTSRFIRIRPRSCGSLTRAVCTRELVNRFAEAVDVDGLGDVSAETGVAAVADVFLHAVPGQCDGFARILLAELSHEVEA